MEDSFRVRLDRAFGSLPLSTSSPSSLASLWSLTGDEINPTPSNRTKQPEPEPEPQSEPKPYTWSNADSSSSSSFGVQVERDLEDLDDEDEEEDGEARLRCGQSKPDDYDDEQWQIRSGIGLDCTLDYEEEEDQYDKQAIGKENQGDRVYMKDINDDGVEIDSCNVLPTRFGEYVRDPRANHLAARIRLKQDDEAAKKIDALHVSEKSAPEIGGAGGGSCGGGGGDAMNLKPILKNKDKPSEHKSQKRVRFDPECDDRGNDDEYEGTRDVRMKASSMEEEEAGSDQSSKAQEFASAVPDYIRNPSRYTRYTFDDSSSDMDDKSNKEAYMSFLSQVKRSNADADDAVDDLPSVTFISKKKTADVTMGENEMGSKQKVDVGKEHRRAFTVGIAAGDSENSDVCAMEEDEPEAVEDVKRTSQRLNRRYRKKNQDELDEPAV